MSKSIDPRVLSADLINGHVLIHFSTGTAVRYHASFLWDVRNHDHNLSIPESAGEDDELIILPD